MVALHGGKPLKVRHGEVVSGKVTFGHRFLAPRAIALKGTPEDYLAKLRAAHVLADPVERRAALEVELARAAKARRREGPRGRAAGRAGALPRRGARPRVAGAFERSNLELPPEVVISEMRNHQRYFAVVDGKGTLKNRFVAVSGTPVKDPKVARHGYERVLRARLADARFFFEEDRKRTLRDRIEELGRRTFQAKLGSELDALEPHRRDRGRARARASAGRSSSATSSRPRGSPRSTSAPGWSASSPSCRGSWARTTRGSRG